MRQSSWLPLTKVHKPAVVTLKGGAQHIPVLGIHKARIILLLFPFGPFVVFQKGNLELQLLGSDILTSTPASVTN